MLRHYHAFGECWHKKIKEMDKGKAWKECLKKKEFRNIEEFIIGENPNLKKKKIEESLGEGIKKNIQKK